MDQPGLLDLPAAFVRHFRVVPAISAQLREVCYRIRHTVYCEEFGFESPRPDGRETDMWDPSSIHCLIQSVTTGDYLGCVRLVMPSFVMPMAPLPFERVCEKTLDRSIVDTRRLPRDVIGEISRLAVIPQFRRNKADGGVRSDDESIMFAGRSSLVPHIQAGLYLGVFALAQLHGVERVFMLVEPRLARQIGILVGVRPQIIGGPVEHRGARVPAVLSVQEVIDSPRFFMRPLFDEIWSSIAERIGHTEPLPHASTADLINRERLARRSETLADAARSHLI